MTILKIVMAAMLLLPEVLPESGRPGSAKPEGKPFWKYESGFLYLFDSAGYETGVYTFDNPEVAELDLNSDGNEELILTIAGGNGSTLSYSVVIFDGAEVYSFVDSLQSGPVIPEIDFNTDLNTFVISLGNTVLDSVLSRDGFPAQYEPRVFLVYDGDILVNVSREMYEVYIRVNEFLMEQLTNVYASNSYICKETEKRFGMLMTAVLNYLEAGETALALKYFDNFYNCPNKEDLRKILRKNYVE